MKLNYVTVEQMEAELDKNASWLTLKPKRMVSIRERMHAGFSDRTIKDAIVQSGKPFDIDQEILVKVQRYEDPTLPPNQQPTDFDVAIVQFL